MGTTELSPETLKSIERFIRKFSDATGIYMGCYDATCKNVVDYSLDYDVNRAIRECVSKDLVGELYARVTIDSIEDQAVENTDIDGMKIASCAINAGGRCRVIFILMYIEEGTETDDERLAPLTYRTTYKKFLESIDLVRAVFTQMFEARLENYKTVEITKQQSDSARVLEVSLKRMKATTEVLKLLEDDKKTEILMAEYLDITSRYLDVSYAFMYKIVNEEERIMDVPAQWNAEGLSEVYSKTHNQHVPDFITGNKTMIFNSNNRFCPRFVEEWGDVAISAIVAIPIPLVDKSNMYAIYVESEKDVREWDVEELQCISDSARVLQNIMERRIQKQSLASSYTSLQEILEHVGCSIVVLDNRNREILFRNQIMKNLFPQENISPQLEQILLTDYPSAGEEDYYDPLSGMSHEILHSNITWVDGRRVSLFAIYDVTDKKNYQRRIEQQAYTDFLTGLFNRLCCERDLARIIDEAKGTGRRGALLYLDLDDFKHINDALGHQWGDVLLKDISNGLRSVKGLSEYCYRMGGDEFVVIIPPAVFGDFDRIIADIKKIFSTPHLLKDGEYYCTMSMGIVAFPDEGERVEDLVQKADVAMYEAKNSGKNRIARYVSGSTSDANRRLDMEKNMRNAAAGHLDEFLVYYQPIIDILKDGTPCCGAEALIRWDSKEMGFISPADFIPLAEYLGLINPIGDYILLEACKTLKYWNTHGHPEFKVNVNLSVVQLMQNDIVERIKEVVETTGITPHNLTLEVTESLAINDMERMKEIMTAIRGLGIRIALDDFGTGYSSLNHIREIPLDVIKVDQSFVRELASDDYSKSFIKMVAELAGAIGVSICVEGVEKEEQYKVLEGMKVRLVQGYHFDRPMTKDAFNEKYIAQ